METPICNEEFDSAELSDNELGFRDGTYIGIVTELREISGDEDSRPYILLTIELLEGEFTGLSHTYFLTKPTPSDKEKFAMSGDSHFDIALKKLRLFFRAFGYLEISSGLLKEIIDTEAIIGRKCKFKQVTNAANGLEYKNIARIIAID